MASFLVTLACAVMAILGMRVRSTKNEATYLAEMRQACGPYTYNHTTKCVLYMEDVLHYECGKPDAYYVCHKAIGTFIPACEERPYLPVCHRIVELTKTPLKDLRPPYLVAE